MESFKGLSLSELGAGPKNPAELLGLVNANGPPESENHNFARVFETAIRETGECSSHEDPIRLSRKENGGIIMNPPDFSADLEWDWKTVLRRWLDRQPDGEQAVTQEIALAMVRQFHSLPEHIAESSAYLEQFISLEDAGQMILNIVEGSAGSVPVNRGTELIEQPLGEVVPMEIISLLRNVEGDQLDLELLPEGFEAPPPVQNKDVLAEHLTHKPLRLSEAVQQMFPHPKLADSTSGSDAPLKQDIGRQPRGNPAMIHAEGELVDTGQSSGTPPAISPNERLIIEDGFWKWNAPEKPQGTVNPNNPETSFGGLLQRVSLEQPPEAMLAGRVEPATEQLFDQVVQGVRLAYRAETGELQINLKPDFLGKLTIRALAAEDHVRIEIRVENEVVRQVMQDNLADLQQRLADKGFPLHQLSLLSGDMGQAAHREPERAAPPLITGIEPETEALPEDVPSPAVKTSIIDYIV